MKIKFIVLSTIIAFWTPKLSLCLLMFGFLATPVWGEEQNVEIVNKPRVNDDQVTLRVKVTGVQNRPEIDLDQEDFQVFVEGNNIAAFNWKSPTETIPTPARIVILLDFSGSMKNLDQRGNTKLEGAIAAIRAFLDVASKRGGDTQVAIAPFGEGRGTCVGYTVDDQTLDNFFPADSPELQKYLNELSQEIPCASTDLYNPLIDTVNFLTEKYPPLDPNLPENSQANQPRLAVILLSDGYHSQRNEAEDFQYLQTILKRNPQITVHTLGYGQSPTELGKLYKCDKTAATRADLGKGKCKVPPDQFVDEERLAEIATLTNGIALFSANPDIIADNLQEFLTAILGEYEITYTQPQPERGKLYSVNVSVTPTNTTSNTEYYRFFWSPLPRQVRFGMLFGIFATLGLGGILPFWLWGKYIKHKATED